MKEENHIKVASESFDELPEFESSTIKTTNNPTEEMQSPPILSTKKKVLKREKSRVQFFIESDPTSTRTADRHRMEDSPSESWKSEYSGTDLRRLFEQVLELSGLL